MKLCYMKPLVCQLDGENPPEFEEKNLKHYKKKFLIIINKIKQKD